MHDSSSKEGQEARRPVLTQEKANIQGKRHFSEEEKKEIAHKMAQRQADLDLAKNERRSLLSQVKDRIDRIELDIQTFSRHYRDGFALQDFECQILYDYDKHEKIYRDVDTGNIIDRRPFDRQDFQRKIEGV